jgi:hypothetical protein
MASNYPTSIDSFTDPLSNSPLNNPSHAGQHQDLNNSVEQLEVKMGVGASAATSATSGQVLTANGSGGSSWQAPAVTAAQFATTGLRLIETRDVTAVATIDFISVFSTDYRGYLLEWNYSHSVQSDLYLQFRDASGVMAGANYIWGWGGSFTSSGVAQFAGFSYQSTAQTSAYMGTATTPGTFASGRLELFAPQQNNVVYGGGQGFSVNYSSTLTFTYLVGGITHNTTGARTGLRLFPFAGTVTGKFSLYGFRN